MKNKTLSKLLITSTLAVSLITTSVGGAFATAALAATPESTQEEKSDKAVVGLAALALIALLGKKSKSDNSTDPAKTATGAGQTTPSQPTTSPGAPKSAPAVPTQPTTTKPTTKPTTTKPVANSPTYQTTGSVTGLTADEKKAIELMNADRIANGLPTLKVNSNLVGLAERYAQDMINRNFFSHYDPEGRSPFDRMRQAGISYRSAGENLAINRSVEAAEKAFMNSSGHRANILNANFTEIGIGVKYSPGGSVYVVQEFIGK